MKKVIVDSSFWAVFPEAQVNVLMIQNIDNHSKDNDSMFYELLQKAAKEGKSFLTEEVFSQNQVIDEWREAFRKFKTKKGARSSIEALLKRASQDREFMPINPLVDFYNSVSLKYAVPAGGEDIHQIAGDLHLGIAQGGEQFLPLGAEEDAPALPEEIIYYDELGAVCRCLNWREAQRTMLREETTDAVLIMESINPEQAKRGTAAMNELKQYLDDYFKTDCQTAILTNVQPMMELS